MSEMSRVEDLLATGVEEPVLPMSRLEAILRGEKITPQSRVEELLLQYNPSDILIEKRITENGTYFAVNDEADGYFKVVVDTPVVPPTVLDHLVETITTNGLHEYTPTHDGFDTAAITVAVPIPPEKILGTKTITENDTYDPSDDSKEVTESFTPPSISSDSYVHIDLTHISDATEVDISVKYYLSGGNPVECNIDISDIPTFTPTSVSDRSSMYCFYTYNSSNKTFISKDATGIWILSKNASGATFIFSNTAYKYEVALDGYSEVTVNVPTPAPVLDDITITENGVYTSEHDGFDEVTVDVSSSTTPKAVVTDKFSIVAKAESAVRDYYATHILIGSSAGEYIMTPLDKNLVNGMYAWIMYDGSSTFNGTFTYSGSDVTFSINGDYDMKITGTSAGLTWWRGSWRDIYMDIYKMKKGA